MIHERSPFWVGPVVAVTFLLVGTVVVPALLPPPRDGQINIAPLVKPLSKLFGVIFAILILGDWIVVQIRKGSARRMFDRKSPKTALASMSWSQFEYYVAETFRRKGYSVERTGDPAGDGGIDVVLRKDGAVTLAQCKHWKSWKVGVQPVRELLGVVTSHGAQAGVLVTSGRFTREAIEFARANRIWLIDGNELNSMISSLQVQISAIPPRPSVPVPAISAAPACPVCKSTMVKRTARRGTNAGADFWGCPRYPGCKGTRSA